MPDRTNKISELREPYLHYRATTANKAASTLRNDDISVRRLIEATGDARPCNITMDHVDRLVAALATGTVGTFNTRLAGVKGFLRWCRARGLITVDPLALIPSRKDSQPDRHRVPVSKFFTLLDESGHPRDRILVALGLWLFLRASEIAHLKIADVDLENAELHVYIQKTNDYDIMPISSALDRELRRWLTFYAETAGELDGNWYLVPAKHPHQPTRVNGRFVASDAVAPLRPTSRIDHPERWVKAVLERTGYATMREGVHTLRRSGARAYFDALCEEVNSSGALKQVSTMLHHSSVTMTERYLGVREDRMARDRRLKRGIMFPSIETPAENVTQLRRVVE